MSTVLFQGSGFQAIEMSGSDVRDLQRFFDRNPAYFVDFGGRPPLANEAKEEIFGRLPEDFPFKRKWTLGIRRVGGPLIGVISVVSDFLVPRVWHIGLFMLASDLHGTGQAQAVYDGFEEWARDRDADWLRLGVVQDNLRAGHFWRKMGFIPVRERTGIEVGIKSCVVVVMVKAIRGGRFGDYLRLVPRDRPEPGYDG